eukprot:COSAG03_NODE_15372_length_432_cov_22.525526_1_plen_36_part_10
MTPVTCHEAADAAGILSTTSPHASPPRANHVAAVRA